MKIVIQCCSTKNSDSRSFATHNGRLVKFVAHPDQATPSHSYIFCKPDDIDTDNSITWRQHLINYNLAYNHQGLNQLNFYKAADLYSPSIYRLLVDTYGWDDIFILSAGWGLIKSDYLIPSYDITFSANSKIHDSKKRKKKEQYNDFNHLSGLTNKNDNIYFFGGLDYLHLYYNLTINIPERKVIYYLAMNIPKIRGYQYIQYPNPKGRKQNWHCSCVKDFINGNLQR